MTSRWRRCSYNMFPRPSDIGRVSPRIRRQTDVNFCIVRRYTDSNDVFLFQWYGIPVHDRSRFFDRSPLFLDGLSKCRILSKHGPYGPFSVHAYTYRHSVCFYEESTFFFPQTFGCKIQANVFIFFVLKFDLLKFGNIESSPILCTNIHSLLCNCHRVPS